MASHRSPSNPENLIKGYPPHQTDTYNGNTSGGRHSVRIEQMIVDDGVQVV